MSENLKPVYPPDCPYCRSTGEPHCIFDANSIDFAMDPNLTPAEKLLYIAQARMVARGRMCPYLNQINPHYDGEESLW